MPNFNQAIPTNNAMKIVTDILAGKAKVEFTHTVASSKDYSKLTDDQLAALTTIDEVKQDVQIKEVNVLNSDTVVIPLRFDNTEVLEDYQIFTIGVYARELDGSEVLYSIMTAKTPQLQPAYDGTSPTTFKINAETIVGKAANVEVIVNPMDSITLDQLNSKLTEYVKTVDLDKLIAEKIPDTLTDSTKAEHITGLWDFDHATMGGKELVTTDSLAESLPEGILTADNIAASLPGDLVYSDKDVTVSGQFTFDKAPKLSNGATLSTSEDIQKLVDQIADLKGQIDAQTKWVPIAQVDYDTAEVNGTLDSKTAYLIY